MADRFNRSSSNCVAGDEPCVPMSEICEFKYLPVSDTVHGVIQTINGPVLSPVNIGDLFGPSADAGNLLTGGADGLAYLDADNLSAVLDPITDAITVNTDAIAANAAAIVAIPDDAASVSFANPTGTFGGADNVQDALDAISADCDTKQLAINANTASVGGLETRVTALEAINPVTDVELAANGDFVATYLDGTSETLDLPQVSAVASGPNEVTLTIDGVSNTFETGPHTIDTDTTLNVAVLADGSVDILSPAGGVLANTGPHTVDTDTFATLSGRTISFPDGSTLTVDEDGNHADCYGNSVVEDHTSDRVIYVSDGDPTYAAGYDALQEPRVSKVGTDVIVEVPQLKVIQNEVNSLTRFDFAALTGTQIPLGVTVNLNLKKETRIKVESHSDFVFVEDNAWTPGFVAGRDQVVVQPMISVDGGAPDDSIENYLLGKTGPRVEHYTLRGDWALTLPAGSHSIQMYLQIDLGSTVATTTLTEFDINQYYISATFV